MAKEQYRPSRIKYHYQVKNNEKKYVFLNQRNMLKKIFGKNKNHKQQKKYPRNAILLVWLFKEYIIQPKLSSSPCCRIQSWTLTVTCKHSIDIGQGIN